MKMPIVGNTLFLTCVFGVSQLTGGYPNELPTYRFYEQAKWHTLTPSVSSISDVRALLGEPEESTDLAHPVASYPGDAIVSRAVLTYAKLMPDWEVLAYFSKSCGRSPVPKLCSIDLIPNHRIPFAQMMFPSTFAKRHVSGADASWDEYSDNFGLRYEVYTTKEPYGSKLPGDLNRISYGIAETR